MSDILKVRSLTKDFKELRAVDDLSFSVKEGEVYGFLGQNGAGKSTTIRMLLTLISPTSGYIEIFGMPLHQKRKEMRYDEVHKNELDKMTFRAEQAEREYKIIEKKRTKTINKDVIKNTIGEKQYEFYFNSQ